MEYVVIYKFTSRDKTIQTWEVLTVRSYEQARRVVDVLPKDLVSNVMIAQVLVDEARQNSGRE